MIIKIGRFGEWHSGLYFIRDTISLLRSFTIDFNLHVLEGYSCFLHQLNHEMLHVIIYILEGDSATLGFDDLRKEFPNLSREFQPLF